MRDAGSWILDPGFWILASGFWLLVTGCWHPASGIWHPASGIWHLASGIWHLDTGVRRQASGIWYPASGIRHPEPGIHSSLIINLSGNAGNGHCPYCRSFSSLLVYRRKRSWSKPRQIMHLSMRLSTTRLLPRSKMNYQHISPRREVP